MPLTDDALNACMDTLQALVDDRALLADLPEPKRRALLTVAGRLVRPLGDERKKLSKEFRRRDRESDKQHDEDLKNATGIRALRTAPVFVTPRKLTAPPLPLLGPVTSSNKESEPESEPAIDSTPDSAGPTLKAARKCYVCKREFHTLHFFYDQMCSECGDFNYGKRQAGADLHGKVALITGARVKIGYQAGILLLRAGAHVVVTTRFPHDAALRYAREPDFAEWQDRLDIHGLDLRHTPSVEAFAQWMNARFDRLDHIIHNACQTVRRPPGFYAHLLEQEHAPLSSLPSSTRKLLQGYSELRAQSEQRHAGLVQPAALSQATSEADLVLTSSNALQLFPQGALDADLQQVDLRTHNSWRLTLAEVPTVELLEVLLVNATAPFVLSSRLKPLMMKVPSRDKHIVNVSAMEGQFYRDHKTDKHPHTNMAKAALNMLTRTSAQDYVKDGIHMNSVDTGWVTDEDPAHIAQRKVEEHGFTPPLDIVDGAARIVDPIFGGLRTGQHAWGQFFKDYKVVPW
jgi:NAD(P)-dependent dehydrogenase (short-subunit alcohol dehydrogenase family)